MVFGNDTHLFVICHFHYVDIIVLLCTIHCTIYCIIYISTCYSVPGGRSTERMLCNFSLMMITLVDGSSTPSIEKLVTLKANQTIIYPSDNVNRKTTSVLGYCQ